jgi:hypothetical protein
MINNLYHIVKALPIAARYKIANSKKTHIIIKPDNTYILTSKPQRWLYHYKDDRGQLININTIKNIL